MNRWILASLQLTTLPSHTFVIARRSEKEADEVGMPFAGNYRRGNLPLLTDWREPFPNCVKTFLPSSSARRLPRGCSSDSLSCLLSPS
jgi:hypothetical protein